MATAGESSGLDISKIYAHYDHVTDTLYGMGEVYGMPADIDGNGNTGSNPPADVDGTAAPAGLGAQYIAAHLNVLNGAYTSDITDELGYAEELPGQYDGNPKSMANIKGFV